LGLPVAAQSRRGISFNGAKLLQIANDPGQNCRGYEKVILAHVIPAGLRLLLVVNETSFIGNWLR
jgi:hypothetical protein